MGRCNMKIIIPSRSRYQNPTITYLLTPAEFRNNMELVCPHDQVDQYKITHPDITVTGRPKEVDNIAKARKWIVEQNVGTRFGMMDDHLTFATTNVNGRKTTKTMDLDISDWYEMFEDIHAAMDRGFRSVGHRAGWVPPMKDNARYGYCGKICQATWYSDTFDPSVIDWQTEQVLGEDMIVPMELLLAGYPSAILNRFPTNGKGKDNSPGGCSEYRTAEMHDGVQSYFADKYSDFVNISEKTSKSGNAYRDSITKKTRVQWVRAYKSTGRQMPTDETILIEGKGHLNEQ